MKFTCPQCGIEADKSTSEVNRAKKVDAKIYCSRLCSGLGRRQYIPKEELVKRKRLYDMEYRQKNLEKIKADKIAYFQRSYDPVKAAEQRKKTMPRHVEYCRQPEYKKYKSQYDKKFRANKFYGPFADSFLLLTEIEKEVTDRATRQEIYQANGIENKSLKRKRDYERTYSHRT